MSSGAALLKSGPPKIIGSLPPVNGDNDADTETIADPARTEPDDAEDDRKLPLKTLTTGQHFEQQAVHLIGLLKKGNMSRVVQLMQTRVRDRLSQLLPMSGGVETSRLPTTMRTGQEIDPAMPRQSAIARASQAAAYPS